MDERAVGVMGTRSAAVQTVLQQAEALSERWAA